MTSHWTVYPRLTCVVSALSAADHRLELLPENFAKPGVEQRVYSRICVGQHVDPEDGGLKRRATQRLDADEYRSMNIYDLKTCI